MENTIIDALNALVIKMGGDAKDNLMIVDALNDIIENYSGGGGGGADFFLVNVTKTGSGAETTYSADKTITQIIDAYDAGKSIYAIYSLSNTNKKVLPLVRLAIGTSARATFCNVESSAAAGTSTVVVTPAVNAITIDKNNVTLYRTFDLLTKEMEVRTIDSESTNYRYPTAKAVFDYVSANTIPYYVMTMTSTTNDDDGTTFVSSVGVKDYAEFNFSGLPIIRWDDTYDDVTTTYWYFVQGYSSEMEHDVGGDINYLRINVKTDQLALLNDSYSAGYIQFEFIITEVDNEKVYTPNKIKEGVVERTPQGTISVSLNDM